MDILAAAAFPKRKYTSECVRPRAGEHGHGDAHAVTKCRQATEETAFDYPHGDSHSAGEPNRHPAADTCWDGYSHPHDPSDGRCVDRPSAATPADSFDAAIYPHRQGGAHNTRDHNTRSSATITWRCIVACGARVATVQ